MKAKERKEDKSEGEQEVMPEVDEIEVNNAVKCAKEKENKSKEDEAISADEEMIEQADKEDTDKEEGSGENNLSEQ